VDRVNEPEDNLFPGVRIVLVETTHPGNIGASARAMKNMGLTELVLVAPEQFPDERAFFRAVSAEDVVNAAKVVNTLDEAIGDCQLVIGTSARNRSIPSLTLTPEACGEKVHAESAAGAKVALLFGRESRGLSNEELQRCQYHVNIPTGEAYTSLNLAMAVQIIAYEILKARLKGSAAQVEWDMPMADSAAVERFLNHLEETLVQLDFHDPDNPRKLMPRLRRLFQRIRMDEMEVSILRGFLAAVNRLKE
ncbi:MAG: RNA methyltransferase, partial [Pseudomonadales bacterium]